jgi:hypothetical protein
MRSTPRTTFDSRYLITALFVVALAQGCGGGGGGNGGGGNGGTTNPPPAGGFTMAVSPTTLSVDRNTTGSVTITITRTGSFSGTVNLAASGVPSGVTAALVAPQITAGFVSSQVQLTVSANATPGTSTITVTGSGTGVSNQSVSFQFTINAPPAQAGPFTLSLSATSHLVHPPNVISVYPIVTITRNTGFTGAVAFSVSGLHPLLTIGFTPSSTTGNTTTAIVISAGAPNGTYTATIRGASAQGDQTITLQIVVASASVGTIKWKFCSASLPRHFFAVKDGNGPWTRIMPAASDTSYSFSLTSGSGQVADVTLENGGYRTTIYAFTAQEMAARAAAQCTLVQNGTTRTVNGSFGGVTGFRTSQVGMGWWFGSANGNGTFTLLNLPPGPLDAVAIRNAETITPSEIPSDRIIIRRGLNPASGATLPVFDFAGAESFPPLIYTWTFGNTIGDSFSLTQMFTTAGGTTGQFAIVPMVDGASILRTVYGVPVAQTVAGDLHQLVATVATVGPSPGSPVRATRQIVAYARTLANRTLNFGPAMPSPTVFPIAAAPAGRIRAQGTLPSEYNTGIIFDIAQAASNTFATILASRGFLGAGNGYDISVPDLTGAIGWDSRFALQAGSPVQWWANGGGALDWFDGRYLFNSMRSRWTGIMTGIVAPADGATYLFARATGTMTP